MDYDLNKREFRGAIRLRYDWNIPDNQSVCVRGARFTVHAFFFYKNSFIRTTRLKFGQKLRTT